MTEFEGQVLADLSVLKSQMGQLMGVGQPGRLHQMERRLGQTERSVQKTKGAVGAFGVLLTLVHLAIGYFEQKRH
jgi:hypothetical protein